MQLRLAYACHGNQCADRIGKVATENVYKSKHNLSSNSCFRFYKFPHVYELILFQPNVLFISRYFYQLDCNVPAGELLMLTILTFIFKWTVIILYLNCIHNLCVYDLGIFMYFTRHIIVLYHTM